MNKTIRPAVFIGTTLGALFLTALMFAALVFTQTAQANPTFFPQTATTATASTSLAYMTQGTGTTTLAYDSYGICGTNQSQSTLSGAASAQVNVQITATTTGNPNVLNLNARFEESQDCIDWYPVAAPLTTATTTLLTSNPYNSFNLTISTSTLSAGGSGTATRIHESFAIPTPERAVRVVFSDPTGGGTYGLWAQIVPTKQQP
jgi:hypothetical protein